MTFKYVLEIQQVIFSLVSYWLIFQTSLGKGSQNTLLQVLQKLDINVFIISFEIKLRLNSNLDLPLKQQKMSFVNNAH